MSILCILDIYGETFLGQNRAKRSSFVNDYSYSDTGSSSGSSEVRQTWDETSLFLTFQVPILRNFLFFVTHLPGNEVRVFMLPGKA